MNENTTVRRPITHGSATTRSTPTRSTPTHSAGIHSGPAGPVRRALRLTRFGFTALPRDAGALLLGLAGARRRAARLALGRSGPPPAGRPQPVRYALAVLPLSLLAFVSAGLCVYGIGAGWLYPLRPDAFPSIGHMFSADPRMRDSWGGPTLFGAWMVHAGIVVAFQAAALPLFAAHRRLRSRIAARRLTAAP
ncbi:hypothetical protein [Phaeacidiphilus oryzae]|uniref:hypothetical protein n=1 Tax=Phaeacidiphilus oryzae TaxID=348818 RepID=UPI000559D9B5|nr:hypothetical protein [Phaeacidiphilus oryzae]